MSPSAAEERDVSIAISARLGNSSPSWSRCIGGDYTFALEPLSYAAELCRRARVRSHDSIEVMYLRLRQ